MPRAKFFPDNFQSSFSQENQQKTFPGPSVKLSPRQDYDYNLFGSNEKEEYAYYEDYDYYDYDHNVSDEYNVIDDKSDIQETKRPFPTTAKALQEPRYQGQKY